MGEQEVNLNCLEGVVPSNDVSQADTIHAATIDDASVLFPQW